MAYVITEECIGCDICRPVCPTTAINETAPIYNIAAETCTECVIDFQQPRCLAVCPVNAIIKHPDFDESQNDLLHKRSRIADLVSV